MDENEKKEPVLAGSFEEMCGFLRIELKKAGNMTKGLKDAVKNMSVSEKADSGEMIANLMLAYRHIEDAAMRVGKAIQAYEGGKSIYDNKDAERAAGVIRTRE